MAGKVTISVETGPMSGKSFTFEDHDTFLFGRSQDCQACLPEDPKISRHHFIVEINPPDATIRDLGSLNGTYVNETKHGGRDTGETPEEGAKRRYPQVDLKDGDRVSVGDTSLKIAVEATMFCCECGKELVRAERKAAAWVGGTFICAACRQKLQRQPVRPGARPARPKTIRCQKCGRDVAGEVRAQRGGAYLCAACRADPHELIRHLLNLAKSGRPELVAIKGYAIEKKLGQGGMGAVYLARQEHSGERVALKIMLPKVAADERAKKLFLREAHLSQQLHHKNVVLLRESGCSEGTFFFTQEFCEGGSLDKIIMKRGGRLSVEDAMRIICDVLDGLDYAHKAQIAGVKLKDGTVGTGHGLVHRDVSPQNVLISGSGKSSVAKVSDYGLSKAFDLAGLSGNTVTGGVAGKPQFWPRQQVINYKYAKPDVDVWATAALLYHMLTGGFPRDFRRGGDLIRTVLDTAPVPILKRHASVPRRLAKVIDGALVDKPDIPFKSAADLKKALQKAV